MSYGKAKKKVIRKYEQCDISEYVQNDSRNNSLLPELVCVPGKRTNCSADDDSEHYLSVTEDAYVPQSIKSTSKRNTKNKFYNCDKCDKHFLSPAHLLEHKVSHSTVKHFTCSMCATNFKRKNALLKHIRNFHTPEKNYCSCGKMFLTKKAVKKHKDDDNCHESLNCSECSARYKTQSSLDSHLLLHKFEHKNITDNKWPYTCPVCGENFSSSTSLSNHTSDKHSQESLPCQYCNKIFRTKQLLRHHLLRKHRYDPSSICTCSVCNREFSMAKDLRRHMESHNIGRYCDCHFCGSKFKSFRLLQSHMKLHSEGKPYDCLICFIPFESLNCLQEHLTNFHKLEIDDETFRQTWNRKCPICGQLFLRRSAAVAHMKSHMDNENTKVILVEEKDDPVFFVDNSNNRSTHNDMYVHIIEVSEQPGQLTRKEINMEDNISSVESKAEKVSFMELIDDQNSMVTDKMLISKTFDFDINIPDENFVSRNEGCSFENVKKSQNNPIDPKSNDNAMSIDVSPKLYSNINEYHENDNIISLKSSEIHMNQNTKSQSQDSPQISLETPDSQIVDIYEAENSEFTNSEETTYICGQCSLVFTNVSTLQSHIINCYNQETSEEYVVVFEPEENCK